jgi:hypothetical protein
MYIYIYIEIYYKEIDNFVLHNVESVYFVYSNSVHVYHL